jgi:two-component system NtrC family sensor kinase
MGSPFTEVILRGEEPILERVLDDAERNGYFAFIPRDPEGWRPMVRGLSGSLVQAFRTSDEPPSLEASELGREDGLAAFLVVEGRKHRLAGMPLGIFLGLAKLLRRAYADRIRSSGFPPGEEARYRHCIDRFFDRNEVASCAAWAVESAREQAEELIWKRDELSRVHDLVAAAKEEWEGTIDCVDDMLLLADAKGLIRRCNRAFQQFVGKPYDQILNRPHLRMLGENGMPAELPCGQSVEHFHERLGRWFVLRIYPFREDPGGEIAGTIVAIHDATEVKIVARELELGNARLKDALYELRRTQSKILRQEKMASVGRMAAGLGRDINRPIGVVVSNLTALGKHLSRLTEFLAEQSSCIGAGSPARLVDAVRRKREEIKLDYVIKDLDDLVGETLEEAERVHAIAGELKSFSRTEESDFRQADINECLRNALQVVKDGFKGRATLDRELAKLPRTRCLPLQMTRVFTDLLLDAARAVRDGGVVTVRSWLTDGYVCIAIGDAGREIPKERLDRILEPFSTEGENGPEEGLGLSVAYDIVRKHEGEIRVRSESGKGTTFTVLVPLVTES